MLHTIALAQCTASDNYQENLILAEKYLQEASQHQAEFLIFPEYFMSSYSIWHNVNVENAQSMDGPFVSQMRKLAADYGIWIAFGMSEAPNQPQFDRMYNTTLVLNKQGEIAGAYHKTHLFDAYHWSESADTIPGDCLFTPIDTPFGRLGIGMCYDLRFPELARSAARSGCQLLIYPSAWVKGDGKETQWKTLLTARALENGIFVAGCDHYSEKVYMGESLVVNPFGTTIAAAGPGEQLLLAHMDLDLVDQAHTLVPSLSHLRVELY